MFKIYDDKRAPEETQKLKENNSHLVKYEVDDDIKNIYNELLENQRAGLNLNAKKLAKILET